MEAIIGLKRKEMAFSAPLWARGIRRRKHSLNKRKDNMFDQPTEIFSMMH
jgi:hypothetical protein